MNFLNLKAVLSLNGSGFALGLKRAESTSKQFAREIKGEFARAFGTAAIIAYTHRMVDLASKISDTSETLGISTKALQEWSFAARQTGASFENVSKYLEELARARERALGGDATAMNAFSKLGIGENDLRTKGLEDLAKAIADTVRSGNIQELLGSLRAIGGEGATKLVPAMQHFNELSEKAGIISDENLEKLRAMKAEIFGMADALNTAAIPAMAKFSELAANGIQVISMGLSAMWAAAAKFAQTSSPASAWRAMNKDFDERFAEWEARRKRIADAMATRQAASSQIPEFDKLHSADAMEVGNKAVRAATSSINRPPLTQWQQAGAGIAFIPEMQKSESLLQRIEQHTKESAILLRAKPQQIMENLGGGFA